MRVYYFSLVELAVVTGIILLISSIALVKINNKPTFVSREQKLKELDFFFSQTKRAAAMQGKNLPIHYDTELRIFKAADLSDDKVLFSNKAFLAKEFREVSFEKTYNIKFLTDNIFHSFIEFICTPDGFVLGPPFIVEHYSDSVKVSFSPLTGEMLLN